MFSEFSIEMRAETRAIEFHVEYSCMLSDFKRNNNVLENLSIPNQYAVLRKCIQQF